MSAKQNKILADSEELNWATGMSRWMTMKAAGGCTDVPDDMDDPALIRWIENQRRDYWNWKQGCKSIMEKEAFDMLGNFGFNWGDENDYVNSNGADEGDHESDLDRKPAATRDEDDATTDEENLERKPRARKMKANKSKNEDGDDFVSDDDESSPPRKLARTESARRPRRESVKNNAATTFEEVEASRKNMRRSSKTSVASTPKGGSKASKRAPPKEETELRTMHRLVPIEDEPRLFEEVKEEFKDLLLSAEPLIEDKENGVLNPEVRVNQAFERQFLEFLVFRKAYGHPYVPKIFPENPSLGRWCCKIRQWKNTGNGHLTESRMKRLEMAGFVWNPKADKCFWRLQAECVQATELWEEMFQELLRYKHDHGGSCLVPKEYEENKRLARWVLKQRRAHKAKHAGEYHTLDDEREQRLIDIGFVFNSRTPELMRQNVFDRFKDKWAEQIEKLRQFKEVYGHAAVPRRWKSDPKLSSWAMRQRAQWRKLQAGQSSHLTAERLADLDSVGFVFGDFSRKDYPVDQCGVWPKPYQIEKRNKKAASNEEENDSAEQAADVIRMALGIGAEESFIGDDENGAGDEDFYADAHMNPPTGHDDGGDHAASEIGIEVPQHEDNSEEGHDAVAEAVVEPEPAVPVKGRWVCATCARDEFLHFIDACAHEAACSGMRFAKVDEM